jgi:hypothetical protein
MTFLNAQFPAPPGGSAASAATYLGTVTGTDAALGAIQKAVDVYNAGISQTGMKVVGTPNRR